MGKDDDRSRKRNKLAKREPLNKISCKPKPPCNPCTAPKEQVVCTKNKIPPKQSPCKPAKPQSVCAKADDQKITGKSKAASGSKLNDLLQFMPKMPPINKETLICMVKCTKDWIMENCDPKKMADASKSSGAGGPGRPMKYPYTFTAKCAQFPLKHYIRNQWIWKYYAVSFVVCLPLFYSISKLANSPGNVAKWAEIRRKEAEEHHH